MAVGNDFKQQMLLAGLTDGYILLFQNDYTPVDTSVLDDFTEADFSGYARAGLDAVDWSVTSADPAVATQSDVSFISDADQAAQTIYGYGLFLDDDTFVTGERFGTAQTVQNDGDQITISPRVRLYTKA